MDNNIQDMFADFENNLSITSESIDNFSKNINALPFEKGFDVDDMSDQERDAYMKDYEKYKVDTNAFEDKQEINVNGSTVQEIFRLSGEDSRYNYNCIRCIEAEEEDYNDIVDFSPIMQETIAEGEAILPTFRYLHQDIFMSLYKYNVEIYPVEMLHIQSNMNRNILSKLINTPAYINLRKLCKGDMFNAGIGTEIIGKKAIEILEDIVDNIPDFDKKKEALERLVEKEEEIDSLCEDLEELEEYLQEMQMFGQTDSQEYQDALDAFNKGEMNLNQARIMAQQMSQDCEELVEANDSLNEKVTHYIDTNVINVAQENVQENSEFIQAWGLGEGDHSRVPFNIKKSVLEKIRSSKHLRDFTDIIGKYKECAIAEQKKKDKSAVVEIKSVQMGNKIENALPSDKMNLCNDITKGDFLRRMTQNQLITYDREAEKQKNKGPIIVCLDRSGSMDNSKITWAKALTIAILEIAQKQKRDFACIPYDSYVSDVIIIEKDSPDPQKMIEIAEIDAQGGTNFQLPLQKSLELIEDSRFKESDIVFITDGDCSISDEFERKFKQTKEDKEFRTLGVLVDFGHNTRTSLKGFCDSITTISKISDVKDANSEINKQIFGSL